MRKLAIFVEGQAEQIFIRRLLEEIGGQKGIQFVEMTFSQDRGSLLQAFVSPTDPTVKYFICIYNCENDEKVKSLVIDQRAKLTAHNYTLILGLRDLFPKTLADLPTVEGLLQYGITGCPGAPAFVLLAVAEVEAWFLAEHAHYQKIDPKLNTTAIKVATGFDPEHDLADSVVHPSILLHQIYSLVGKAYKKTRNHVNRTVDVLDYCYMYITLPTQLTKLRELVTHIDGFLV